MKKVNVRVNRRDIEAGERRNCKACPVALAVRRRVRAGVTVKVLQCGIHLDGVTVATPPEVAYHVGRFDAGGVVEPFSFVVAVPDRFVSGK